MWFYHIDHESMLGCIVPHPVTAPSTLPIPPGCLKQLTQATSPCIEPRPVICFLAGAESMFVFSAVSQII